jgi:hypothetical protein
VKHSSIQEKPMKTSPWLQRLPLARLCAAWRQDGRGQLAHGRQRRLAWPLGHRPTPAISPALGHDERSAMAAARPHDGAASTDALVQCARDVRIPILRAIYRYIRSAGPAGQPAPAYAPPGEPVSGPVIQFP